MLKDICNKSGSFCIKIKLIKEYPEIVLELLNNVLIWKAVFIDFGNTIHYIGFSKKFDTIEEHNTPQEYNILYKRKKEVKKVNGKKIVEDNLICLEFTKGKKSDIVEYI